MAEYFDSPVEIAGSGAGPSTRTLITLDSKYFTEVDGGGLLPILSGTMRIIRREGGGGADTSVFEMDGVHGYVIIGGAGADGRVLIKNDDGDERISLEAINSRVIMRGGDGQERLRLDGRRGDLLMGSQGRAGNLLLFPGSATGINDWDQATVNLNGKDGSVRIGGSGVEGALHVTDESNNVVGKMCSGGHLGSGSDTGRYGRILLTDSWGNVGMILNREPGILSVGGSGKRGCIEVRTRNDEVGIEITPNDIEFRNADCAEEFDISESDVIEPGDVMVIDEQEKLRLSTAEYDKKVAGVISGACNFAPGIVLGRRPSAFTRMPLALAGKVYCKVDAQYSPIEIGDLLTTSHTPGYAMKASDPIKAFGSVIGKALNPLPNGRGLIPILVSLL